MAAFLDIEGAFNNVTTLAIQQALTDLDVEEYINNWLVNMLKSRIVTANLGNSVKSKQDGRSTPQVLFGQAAIAENLYTLPSLIKEYQNNYEIQWAAIISKQINQELDNNIKLIQLPKVIVTKKSKINKVRNNLPGNSVTLAVVGEHEMEEVNALVQHFLKTKHFNHILWIYPKANMQQLWRLSNISWNYGNIKVLYYVRGRIYTFEPLPYIKIKLLRDFQQYVKIGNIVDFQKYPLTFPIISNSPRCYRYINFNKNINNTGYMFKIMSIFMQQYNFEFEEYPYDYESYNRADLFKGLMNKSFDFVLDNLFLHPMMAFSDVMWNNKLYLIVPYPKPLAKDDYFRYSMKPPVFICTIVLLVSITALFVIRQKPCNRDITRTALYMFATLNYQFHFPVKQCKVLKYFVTFVMFFYSLLSTTLFWCSISNLMVLNVYEEKLHSFADVNKSPYQILISQSDFDYMNQLDLLPPILETAKVAENKFVKHHLFQLNTTYIYKALEDKANYMLFQQRRLKVPLMYKLEVSVYSIPMYFPLRHNLPYIQLFNRYLRYLMDSGVMLKLLDDAKWDGIYSGYIRFLKDPTDGPDYGLQQLYFSVLFFKMQM
ncbi:uncharacterized protein LOC135955452 [Calliphora vicina]|uniref:uncharacterized protein LOC135955452 n=1 Tax=Calliphora vicina TaxID=7373 RepID=UPI00325A9B06